MTHRSVPSWRTGPPSRRGAIRQRGRATLTAIIGEWLADRTIRRKWRRLSISDGLIVVVGLVVGGAFLLLLGMQAWWLAVLVAIALLGFLYWELGA